MTMGETMRAEYLQNYLHKHIPLSAAMAVTVESIEADAVTLAAPLAPNINHRDTVFGGSASALAMLAAWSLLMKRLQSEGTDARLVIQRNSMDFKKPIIGTFTAHAVLEKPEQWAGFTQMLARKGRARIAVPVVLECEGELVGRFAGEFVALAATGD